MSTPSETLDAFAKSLQDGETEIELEDVDLGEVDKGLNSRSFPALNSYVQRGLYADAHAPITRTNSALVAPEGRGPVMAETVTHNTGNEYNSCNVHGTTYKSAAGCQICFVTKSYSCNGCGGDMMKVSGGLSKCQKCGA